MVHHSAVPWFAAILLAVTFFAGCLGADESIETQEEEDQPGPSKDDTVFDEETGAIWGVVSTDTFMPIENARGQVLTTARTETDYEAESGEEGEFVVPFVEPGKYIVYVTAIGFEAQQRQVTVNAGEMSEIRLVMTPLPQVGPYAEEFDRTGFVNAAVAWQAEPAVVGCVTQESPVGVTDPKSCGGLRYGGESGETRVGPEPAPPGWPSNGWSGSDNHRETDLEDVKTVLVEMVWTPAGPFGEHFSLDLLCSDVPRGSNGAVLDLEHPCYLVQTGSSPLIHRVDEEHWIENDYNYTGTWAARVFATHGMLGTYDLTGIDIGLAYQQSFEKYWTIFHGDPAPEDYTRLPDA